MKRFLAFLSVPAFLFGAGNTKTKYFIKQIEARPNYEALKDQYLKKCQKNKKEPCVQNAFVSEMPFFGNGRFFYLTENHQHDYREICLFSALEYINHLIVQYAFCNTQANFITYGNSLTMPFSLAGLLENSKFSLYNDMQHELMQEVQGPLIYPIYSIFNSEQNLQWAKDFLSCVVCADIRELNKYANLENNQEFFINDEQYFDFHKKVKYFLKLSEVLALSAKFFAENYEPHQCKKK